MSQTFRVVHIRKWFRSAWFILFPLIGGALIGWLIAGDTVYYSVLIRPPFAPPGILFPIVWSILYVLMGIALCLVTKSRPNVMRRDAVQTFLLQLLFNYLWPILFFHFRLPLLAFFDLLVLWILLGICTAQFYRIRKSAGWLLLPSLLWTTFAGYLNFAVWLLNQ